MEIRTANADDLIGLLKLYTQLHRNPMPEMDEKLLSLWQQMLKDDNYHIVVGTLDEKLIASCVLVVVANLTHQQRPYALIENVVTDENYRNNGYATAVLNYAKALAVRENCYKLMLMTGSTLESTLRFYERAGYNSGDKTALVQWL